MECHSRIPHHRSGIDFTAVTESLQGLWQSVWDFAELVGGTLAEAYNTVLKPILGWVIEDAVSAAVDVFTAAFDALSAVLKPVSLKKSVECSLRRVKR